MIWFRGLAAVRAAMSRLASGHAGLAAPVMRKARERWCMLIRLRATLATADELWERFVRGREARRTPLDEAVEAWGRESRRVLDEQQRRLTGLERAASARNDEMARDRLELTDDYERIRVRAADAEKGGRRVAKCSEWIGAQREAAPGEEEAADGSPPESQGTLMGGLAREAADLGQTRRRLAEWLQEAARGG